MSEFLVVVAALLMVAAVCAGGLMLDYRERDVLLRVQGGQVALWCHMEDGYRQIEASKINGFDGEKWEFVNGGATRCNIQ